MSKILIDTGPSERGWHGHELFLRCGQLYAYEKLLGFQGNDRNPLIRGSLGHTGVAHHYARQAAAAGGIGWAVKTDDGSVTSEMITDPERFWPPEQAVELLAIRMGADWMKQAPTVQKAVRDYTAWAYDADRGYRVHGIEREVKAEIRPEGRPPGGGAWLDSFRREDGTWAVRELAEGEGYLYTVRIDLELELGGYVSVIDTKTSMRMEGGTIEAFGMDGQFLGLDWFGRALHGPKFAGLLVNVVNLGGDAPSFGRARPNHSPWAIRRFPANITRARHRIAQLIREERNPWDWDMATSQLVCRHRYGRCEHFHRCMNGPS